MKKLFVIISATLTLAFASCKKEILIDLNSSDPKIVIEGEISNEVGPYYVKISKTVNFSDANAYPAVTGAFITISDNAGTIDTLSEVSAGLYKTHNLIGQPGRTYNLFVSVEDKKFYASSTMPQSVSLDTLAFTPFTNQGENDFMTIPVFTDPATTGNNYRFIQTINGKTDKSFIVQNDNIFNGEVNQSPIFSMDAEIKAGDSVRFEMRCIDLSTYNYFYTLAQISGGFGGQTTPSNPPNNITGDFALGIFSAYTKQIKTQVAQ